MKTVLLCSIALLFGCGGGSYVRSDTTLGRVVVYRNGVAYFERSAEVDGDSVRLSVPADKVDDFLKSLTVVDERNGASAPIAYPSMESRGDGLIDMRIQLTGRSPHKVKLTYVTEAPAWKPSYRVTLGKDGKVTLEGLAIVDNTSGEDWNGVRLGVASSSALSFRFDLRSVRVMQREVLQASEPFAIAPPSGAAVYGGEGQLKTAVIGEINDAELGSGARYMTREEQLEQGRAAVARYESASAAARRHLEQARAQKDVVKTACLNDKLGQMDTAGRTLRERFTALESALARNDKDAAGHESSVLAAARSRLDQVTAESNQCVGQELAFVGNAVNASMRDERRSRTVQLKPAPPKPAEKRGDVLTGGTFDRKGEEPPRDVSGVENGKKPALGPNLPEVKKPEVRTNDVEALATKLKTTKRRVVIEGYAGYRDADKLIASLDRATRVRDELIARGVDPDQVAAIGNGMKPGQIAGVRVIEVPTSGELSLLRDAAAGKRGGAGEIQEPVGSAHFEAQGPMSVGRGSSAMVSMLKAQAEGGAVYLYDRESARGNDAYAFRAVRIRNPTGEALESGPVTVLGEGRFIGEGLCEPIPAHGVAFVPFALDRQIVVERKETERDELARVLSAQRGVLSAEVRHVKRRAFTLKNRLAEVAVVYVRHTVAPGYELGSAPALRERMGAAHLFRADVPAHGELEIAIEESTPQSQSIDVRTPEGIELVRGYLGKPGADAGLESSMRELVERTRELDTLEQRIATTRDQMKEIRARMEELERQVISLRLVKSAAPLLTHLEKKLRETNDKLSQSTLDLVALEEKRMIARVRREEALSAGSFAPKVAAPPASR